MSSNHSAAIKAANIPPRLNNEKKAKKVRVGQSKDAWDLIVVGRRSGRLEFFTDDFSNEPYVTIKYEDGRSQTDHLDSGILEQWLRVQYLEKTGTPISNGLVSDALATVRAVTAQESNRIPVFKRIGYKESGGRMVLYYDLANVKGEAVEVTADGWQVTTYYPVKFRRTGEMESQVTPVAGGSFDELWKLYPNIQGTNRILHTAFILCGYNPKGPWFGESIIGPQGSGKSTVTEGTAKLVDPNKSIRQRSPKDVRDAAVAFTSKHLATLDNISMLSQEMSDLLCMQSTGGAVVERLLRTNGGVYSARLGGPFQINGIPDSVRYPDLLSRILQLNLPKINREGRKSEESFWLEFEESRPRILGAIFTILSSILKNLPTVKIDKLPRMADAVIWVTAAEEALGWEPGAFLKVYDQSANNASMNVLEGHPLADALLELMKNETQWIGTAKELVEKITPNTWPLAIHKLPDSPAKLRNALRRLAVDLPAIGLEAEMTDSPSRKLPSGADAPKGDDGQSRSERWIVITRLEKEDSRDDS
jgi:hypothetical protein